MHVHDVLIVGAGPAGLAVAARLREHTPSATFTDDEHERYHWIKKHGRKMTIKNYRTNRDSLPEPSSTPGDSEGRRDNSDTNVGLNMLVLDADGCDWMSKWKRLFKTFNIDYLRSPMFFHVDPADRDALLGYAYEKKGGEKDLLALPGCAGKELSKHRKKKKLNAKGRFLGRTPDVDERDRKDYYTPSTDLFHCHCAEVVDRYDLSKDMLKHERVMDIGYDDIGTIGDFEHDSVMSEDAPEDERKIFRIKTDQGVHYAHVVVLAVGPGNAPTIPTIPGLPNVGTHDGFAHAMHIKQFPPSHVTAKVKARRPTNIVIVGGGLTSIQLADVALKRGVSQVYLLMRGPLKVKYFDLDLDWVGKFRNYKQAEFWTADTDEERFEMYAQARNGGSITPRYRKILDAHITSGKMSLHTYTKLQSVSWDSVLKTWSCTTTQSDIKLPPIDYIIFATGVQSDIRTIPYLQTIQQRHPIECVGGLPCLTDDLMWSDDVPLFVTGRFAGLRLGPGAPNLVGARIGAERIAWNVDDVLKKLGRTRGIREKDVSGDDGNMEAYVAARDNRFDSLIDMDDASS
ncbi:FAD/NAD(P)-binding domain-containing protein [Plenodomus tracheiphilus IPT5]|uniref:FAD/NAD(P)-binding domain-containing protein n=1 Tax=Plenodomus tracheiphilus IPT5 TaxID=1408161 RepID=A0A6A7BJM5_9PLEO|nr:FAD/NAD(P)-binding domain-containing protein [Plenodomus tracheiphilus IPT5]